MERFWIVVATGTIMLIPMAEARTIDLAKLAVPLLTPGDEASKAGGELDITQTTRGDVVGGVIGSDRVTTCTCYTPPLDGSVDNRDDDGMIAIITLDGDRRRSAQKLSSGVIVTEVK